MKSQKKTKTNASVPLVRKYHQIATNEGEPREYLVKHSRGVLSRTVRTSLVSGKNLLPSTPRIPLNLDEVCQEARDVLEEHEYATDQTRLPPEELDFVEERLCDDEVLWYHDVIHESEELSEVRIAGDLLMTLLQLEKLPHIEQYMPYLAKAMFDYGEFRVSQINSLAAAGAASIAGRAAGPIAKSKKLYAIRRIVWHRAVACWLKFPAYKGITESTASQIADDVRADIAKANLGSKTIRSLKTIGDDLRAGRRSKVFPDWPIKRTSELRSGQSRR
ncbi:hypothetical protein FNL55_26340 [Tardiphaga sp. vice352]|uniref:hypothetical protein n=1 Tax=unclassified Tardiphaga TaxID=2631404 RepID=UPI001162CB34|nr:MULTISPECIES: hypothetical protein [unclassified Tardiphaga]QDM19156.1 hypothetical protein FNL53_26890 [Tardiphaga sp. vice278]QDM29357.1 hypothetical protein FNL56_27055 [Tardiphaga sp. vice304]QDM34463.1 hypothetical protein FNL55_26340 [Tardiphaga sp. vice352]